nr:hypothetical protein [Haloferax sp. ATB1]
MTLRRSTPAAESEVDAPASDGPGQSADADGAVDSDSDAASDDAPSVDDGSEGDADEAEPTESARRTGVR